MKTKKNEKFDLDKSRATFFWIGMTISMLMVISAFEWQSQYDTHIMDRGKAKDILDPIIPITEIKQPKPPKPRKKVIDPVLNTVDDEITIDSVELIIDLDDLNLDELDSLIGDLTDETVDNTVYNPYELEKMPEPNGGYEAFYSYVGKNLKYPRQAQQLHIEGKVFVAFVIDQTGRLTELSITRGIGGGCDKEALRVLEDAPAWRPGKQRGRPVKVRMVLPITFQLN